jgi:putative chitinase
LEENLNYKAATLMKLWPRRFPTLEKANEYSGNPKKIANSVYSSRMGNRDENSGDGFRFRGRGIIQLTGHSSYFHCGKALGVDFVGNPDLVSSPKYAALSGGWFWSTHNLNSPADALDYTKVTKIINGGTIGLDDRIKHVQQALAVLA